MKIALMGTFNIDDATISFGRLPIVREDAGLFVLELDGQHLTPAEIDDFVFDSVEVFDPEEVAESVVKADLEEILRLRAAHRGLCHPNVPLVERTGPERVYALDV